MDPEAELLDPKVADTWNLRLATGSMVKEHDEELYATALEQQSAHLISDFMTKAQFVYFFNRGAWKAIRRYAIWQNGKIRGTDNARTSGHNAAAFMMETIMTGPPDLALQILKWLVAQELGVNVELFFKFRPALGSDDLQGAHHGVPNIPSQHPVCVIAIPDMSRHYRLCAPCWALRRGRQFQ